MPELVVVGGGHVGKVLLERSPIKRMQHAVVGAYENRVLASIRARSFLAIAGIVLFPAHVVKVIIVNTAPAFVAGSREGRARIDDIARS